MKMSKVYQKVSDCRERFLTKIVTWLNPIYQKMMPRNKAWQLTKEDLNQYPEGSLGKNLAEFLHQNKFDMLPYLETHDVYHVLLGYKPTIIDEARLYFWLLGNGKRSVEVFSTVLAGFVFLPEYWGDLMSHYRKGKACRNISHWDFRTLMTENTELLRGVITGQIEPLFFISSL